MAQTPKAKDFREIIRNLEREDRRVRHAQARAEGRKLGLEPNEVEAEILDQQQQLYLSDWTPSEQERFKAEQDKLWALIPEQFRQRAQKMARGQWAG